MKRVLVKKELLESLYLDKKFSVSQIAEKLGYSHTGINYLFKKFNIKKRTIGESIYLKWNPKGDPFEVALPQTPEDYFLFGLGLGLFWGEGTKRSPHSVRLGNTDPDLIKVFVIFLIKFFKIKKSKLRFGLQLFNDISEDEAKKFWMKKLSISDKQFYKTIISISGKKGTYKNKVKYGVLTVYFNNKKLRDFIISKIDDLR